MSLEEKEEKYEYYPDYKNAPYGVARLGPKYNYCDIFDKFPRNENYWSYLKIRNYFLGFAGGLYVSLFLNKYNNHSLFYKSFKVVGTGLLISALMFIYDKNKNLRECREQAMLRNYVELHPDRFPVVERKKYKDLVLDWRVYRNY